MSELEATGVMIALFALRCLAPLALTIGIGYLMNRLVDRWRAEDEAREAAGPEPEMQPLPRPALKVPTITIPCWVTRDCPPDKADDCPAKAFPAIPCWMARMQVEGRLPDTCPDCPIYTEAAPALA
jgi:hypothetical protein